MFLFIVRIIVKCALWLRYSIHVKGLDDVIKKYGTNGILFLPNHPGLIDPVIVSSVLIKTFKPRALVHDRQVNTTILKHCWKQLNILPMPDLRIAGRASLETVVKQINVCIETLRAGDNLLFYPAGRIYRSHLEKLRGNGGAHHIIAQYEAKKVVMVRTTGLWGSDFSRAKGYQMGFGEIIKRHFKHIFLNFIFFMPRRSVNIEFVPAPDDFPFGQTKEVLNRYLESFYNLNAPGNTYVPYGWWENGGNKVLPDPESFELKEETSIVPNDIKEKINAKLRELTGKTTIRETETLGTDLGLDSIVLSELQNWLQETFEQPVSSPETLRTVASLYLAAIGESAGAQPLRPIPPQWFFEDDSQLRIAPGKNLGETFLYNARKYPDRPLYAEQGRGVLTNRKAVLTILVLANSMRQFQEERIGMLMPATLVTTMMYMALIFAGKIPVMINWTVGNRNLKHCMDNANVKTILTSSQLIEKLRGQGIDFTDVDNSFVFMENLSSKISLFTKLKYALLCRISWKSLDKAPINNIAAILFTSGSENLPKAVPVTHENLLANLINAVHPMNFRRDISMIGMLPPFHSFGLLLNIAYTVSSNIRCVYHPNPTEGEMIARLVSAYKVNFICGTPTFIANMARRATLEQVASLQYVILGAEKCSAEIAALIKSKCINAHIYEGYGITECGPIVSLNMPGAEKEGSIGRPLACTQAVVVDENCTRKVPANTTGMLLLRGPSIFNGYLNYDGPSPFVEFNGRNWYKTGDLVAMDEENFIHFKGRLKRFVKIAGEMISLPAIEDTLNSVYRVTEKEGPTLAVESIGQDDQHPNITLFTTIPLEREAVNHTLREHGFSPIQSIHTIIIVNEIPVLGTGKTDYRTLANFCTT